MVYIGSTHHSHSHTDTRTISISSTIPATSFYPQKCTPPSFVTLFYFSTLFWSASESLDILEECLCQTKSCPHMSKLLVLSLLPRDTSCTMRWLESSLQWGMCSIQSSPQSPSTCLKVSHSPCRYTRWSRLKQPLLDLFRKLTSPHHPITTKLLLPAVISTLILTVSKNLNTILIWNSLRPRKDLIGSEFTFQDIVTIKIFCQGLSF